MGDKNQLKNKETSIRSLERLLRQASMVEHLLINQYLYAAFSLKKYPEEFGVGLDEELVQAQIERNRRWEAGIMYVARQEMEHLCMVQNMMAILGSDSYLWRPNYPVPPRSFPLDIPIHLMPFSQKAIEIFRYVEKPDSIDLESPFGTGNDHQGIVEYSQELFRGFDDPFATEFTSVQQMYEAICSEFKFLIDNRYLDGKNPNRIVNEHFGFNIELEPLIQSDWYGYIKTITEMIVAQGEGVGSVPPPLGSHFMKYQEILDGMRQMSNKGGLSEFALPVVNDAMIGDQHALGAAGTKITNPYTIGVMQLFNDCYELTCRMLTGFFNGYDVNQTTGIHPPRVNAWFQNAFYPMMTMIIRPMGEIVCRLPAFKEYIPEKGKLPAATAGPSFELDVQQGKGHGDQKRASVAAFKTGEEFSERLRQLSEHSEHLAKTVPEGYEPLAGRNYQEQLHYISQNLFRMSENFILYWKGEMVTVIPSENFQNLEGIN